MTIYASKQNKGFYDSEIHSSLPSDVVEITKSYHRELLEGQSNGKIINFETDSGIPVLVEPDGPTIEDIRNRKWDEIKNHRDRLMKDGGYKVGDYWFHSDTFSRSQQLGLISMGESIPAGIMWKTMSGEFVEMTYSLAQQVLQAAALQDNKIFIAAEQHKEEMMKSEDPANYDITIGWPEVYVQ